VSRAPLTHDMARLLDVGRPTGPSTDEALTIFGRLRRTSHEARALEELAQRHAASPLPETLAVAAASALIDRGEPVAAISLLDHASSAIALMLRAELESQRGQPSAALALVERVLLRDIEHPGAREQHRRLRETLGLGPALEIGAARHPEPASTWIAREPDTPYLLHREIARGGAAVVYEAEDRDLGRRIALKMVHDPVRQRDQLLHEARVASALAGPGVVRVFDIDPEHGWIALEWARGGALRDRLRERDVAMVLPIEGWALPLCRTLARIHASQWLHLDIKPANVLFSKKDAPLLADFGIARRLGEAHVAGSVGYVSPERLAGAPSDPRDDIYGFGRLIEDVVQSVDLSDLSDIVARWRPLIAACVAPRETRVASARDLERAMLSG